MLMMHVFNNVRVLQRREKVELVFHGLPVLSANDRAALRTPASSSSEVLSGTSDVSEPQINIAKVLLICWMPEVENLEAGEWGWQQQPCGSAPLLRSEVAKQMSPVSPSS